MRRPPGDNLSSFNGDPERSIERTEDVRRIEKYSRSRRKVPPCSSIQNGGENGGSGGGGKGKADEDKDEDTTEVEGVKGGEEEEEEDVKYLTPIDIAQGNHQVRICN